MLGKFYEVKITAYLSQVAEVILVIVGVFRLLL